MGLSSSKRVRTTFTTSPEFSSSCNSVYIHCISTSQHAFEGVKPYQLYDAAQLLHQALSQSIPLISKWVPTTPDRVQIDRAFKDVIKSRRSDSKGEELVLDEAEFKEFAVELFARAVVSSLDRGVLKRVAVGVAGIGGAVMVVKPGKGILVAAIGAYALGVATDIFMNLAG